MTTYEDMMAFYKEQTDLSKKLVNLLNEVEEKKNGFRSKQKALEEELIETLGLKGMVEFLAGKSKNYITYTLIGDYATDDNFKEWTEEVYPQYLVGFSLWIKGESEFCSNGRYWDHYYFNLYHPQEGFVYDSVGTRNLPHFK